MQASNGRARVHKAGMCPLFADARLQPLRLTREAGDRPRLDLLRVRNLRLEAL